MNFQKRVQKWMHACFSEEISADRLERGDRFLEEVIELLQSVGYPRERISALEDYVYSRPVGHPSQEVGGVMLTLAAFCEPHGLDMTNAGEEELFRCWGKVEAIRAKQASKPTGSALPIAAPHGWICWNEGPEAWFWAETRDACEHELSEDIRPATSLEKLLMNRVGNSTEGAAGSPPPQTHLRGITLSKTEVKALLFGQPKHEFTAAMTKLAKWLAEASE